MVPNERLTADVLAVLRDSVRDKIFPGAVAALISRAGEIYIPFGCETYDPGGAPIAQDSIFDIASLTKIVATATAVMQLVERKHLSLDDHACDFLPRLRQAPKDRITIAQLLAHTAGFPGGEPLRRYETRDGRVNAIFAMDLAYAPGTGRIYDDLGYILLALIVEAVAGVAFDTYCENEILLPLGMRETMFVPPAVLLERIVPTEVDPGRGGLLRGVVHDGTAYKLGGVAGHAGLFSTAGDLARFCRAMMGHAEGALGAVLSSASVQRMWSRQWQDGQGDYGLGWDRLRPSYMNGLDDGDAVGHTGFTGVSVVISPRRALAMILLSNRVHPVRSERSQINLARCRLVEAAMRRW